MIIRVKCVKCSWQGIANIGWMLSICSYECPVCGKELQRTYREKMEQFRGTEERAKEKDILGL